MINESATARLARDLRLARSKAICGNVVRSEDVDRGVRERLTKGSWLQEIHPGYYLLVNSEVGSLGTTFLYPSYFDFCSVYLADSFGKNYYFSPESSLGLHLEVTTVPRQLVVNNWTPSNRVVTLPGGLSLVVSATARKLPKKSWETLQGVNVLRQSVALALISPRYFISRKTELHLSLAMLEDTAELSQFLVEHNLQEQSRRLCQNFLEIGRSQFAQRIENDFALLGILLHRGSEIELSKGVQEKLTTSHKMLFGKSNLYRNRLSSLWSKASNQIEKIVLEHPSQKLRLADGLPYPFEKIEDLAVHDAYNSLSIEGYQVSMSMIQKIETGDWDPAGNERDKSMKDALASKGYLNAFNFVLSGLQNFASKGTSTDPYLLTTNYSHQIYQQLFAPSAEIGLIKRSDLFGTRQSRVMIRGSLHVPPRFEAVPDYLDTLFDLISNQSNGLIKAILAHYFFVWIHPYTDGNGRTTRLLMNSILVNERFFWCVVQKDNRSGYFSALERASSEENWVDFAKFILVEMKVTFERTHPFVAFS